VRASGVFMYEALERLGGGRGERVDVVAHVACAVAVGGVAEHRANGRADRLGSCKTPRSAAPKAAPATSDLAGATCLTQTHSIDKPAQPPMCIASSRAARTG